MESLRVSKNNVLRQSFVKNIQDQKKEKLVKKLLEEQKESLHATESWDAFMSKVFMQRSMHCIHEQSFHAKIHAMHL